MANGHGGRRPGTGGNPDPEMYRRLVCLLAEPRTIRELCEQTGYTQGGVWGWLQRHSGKLVGRIGVSDYPMLWRLIGEGAE